MKGELDVTALPGGRAEPAGLSIGLYGKLPSHGDFLQRRVSPDFVAVWDAWLQDAVATSRAALGERWLEMYLTSPVWRFYCAAGACGSTPVVGLMVPSVDSVGRYFPFTVVVALSPAATPGLAIRHAGPVLSSAERLVLDLLDASEADFAAFDDDVVALGERHAFPALPRMAPGDASAVVDNAHRAPWHIAAEGPEALEAVLDQLLAQRLTSIYGPISLWWTEGSMAVEPSSLLVGGLPAPQLFAAMMDGTWTERGWRTLAVEAAAPPASLSGLGIVTGAGTALQFRSAALSDVGRVRRANQDACIERTEVGIWAVADGLGGLSEGDLASRMVCDALADVAPAAQLEVTLERARQRIAEVNEYLHSKGEQRGDMARSASTVVALVACGEQIAACWAGDSRMYRLRHGALEQVTRDHSFGALPGAVESTAITRAVGAEPTLALDVVQMSASAGDRYLLCTDGLTRVLSDDRLAEHLGRGSVREAVHALVNAALEAGGPDNVTALVVEAGQ